MAAYSNSQSGYHHQQQHQHSHQQDQQHPIQQHPSQHHQPQPRQSQPTTTLFADDHDATVLDPSILDTGFVQSPSLAIADDSPATMNNTIISPSKSQGWEQPQFGSNSVTIDTTAGAHISYRGDQISPFSSHNLQHTPSFSDPSAQWRYSQDSGNGVANDEVESMPPPPSFDGNPFHHHRQDSAHGSLSHVQPNFPTSHQDTTYNMQAPQVQTPMSPHSHQDWMGMAQQEMEARPMQKRVRPNSPSTLIDLARQDGIRKKNNRIDIPSERTLTNIDNMIDNARDEETVKELKQQKRLLRNREAALASRQRKKKHTEDLEVKEKGYTHQITILEKDVSDLAAEIQRRDDERHVIMRNMGEALRTNEMLQEQMRNMQMEHLEETSTLRKKINILMEQPDGFAPPMSADPSSAGFTDFNAEMEALNMGAHEWEKFMFNDLQNDQHDDYHFDVRHGTHINAPTLEKKASATTIVPISKKAVDAPTDPPIASSLLFMLLLCGAFVASKPPSSQPRDMIKMPDHVLAAAPTILCQLLSETGDLHDAPSMPHHTQAPQQSNVPFPEGETSSRLGQMHFRLISATKQQEIDQAFALTPSRWASIANVDLTGDAIVDSSHNANAPHGRRNLAAALQEMYPEQPSKAEVYTRSLLWEQVPGDVVKQFKQMVRDHSEIEARQGDQRNSDGLDRLRL